MPSLAHLLAAFAGLGELAVTFGMDGGVVAEEFVFGRDVANGAVQPRLVVMSHVIGNKASGVFQGQRHLDADTLAFDGLVIAFELAVGLGIIRRSTDMG